MTNPAAVLGRSLKSLLTSQPWLKPAFKTVNNLRCRTWDVVHGVDTCGEIPLVDLDFQSAHKSPGLEYQSHHPSITRAAIGGLPIQYENYTFIDIGCGKGRVLLVASEFPFRRILGVEFAPTLADTARRNLQSYRGRRARCSTIEVITADATEYELAPEPQVLYFFSPFQPTVLDQIVKNIEASYQRQPRDLLILFSGTIPMREYGFGSRPQYERLERGRYVDVYRHRSAGEVKMGPVAPTSTEGAISTQSNANCLILHDCPSPAQEAAKLTYKVLHRFPPPDLEATWRAGLTQVEFPAFYDAPEYFLDPFRLGTDPFAILVFDEQRVVGVLTGAHWDEGVICGTGTRPQICFSRSVNPVAVGDVMARALLSEAGSAKLVSVYTWNYTPLEAFERYGFRARELEGAVVLDLTQGLDTLFKRFEDNRRRNIRFAMKRGVEVYQASSREDMLAYYEILARWRQTSRKRIVYPEIPLDLLEHRYRLRENIRLFLARYAGKAIAGSTVRFLPGGLLESANNASLDEFLHLKPNDLLLWKVMEWACSEGFLRYSLGAAHPFLKRYGGTVVPIRRYRLDRTWLRRHDLREVVVDFGRESLRQMPRPVEKSVRRFLGKT